MLETIVLEVVSRYIRPVLFHVTELLGILTLVFLKAVKVKKTIVKT